MAVTTTSRFGLPQWSAGADTPSRVAFNDAFAKIDAGAAKDAGAAGGTSLPTTGLADGMYASTVDGIYRRHFRRAGGAWAQVGGNTWAEQTYHRADAALATSAAARTISHPSLNSPTAVENWDGSSLRGGRQAVGDLNAGQPGAVHVGDTDTPVDLSTRGRVYARTRASGERGFVASAHANNAGPLFAAREPGGTDPWLVDSQGRMRSQAPTAFGAIGFAAGVPLAAAPGASDHTAADLYAASGGKAALQVLRSIGDQTPIARIEQDRIILGRSSWSGARIDLLSPDTRVTGPLSVSGATSLAALTASGVSASSLDASGRVRGRSVVADDGLQAEGGRIYSQGSGSGALLLSRPPTQYSGSNHASLRQSSAFQSARNPELYFGQTTKTYDQTVIMPEDGWMRLDSVIGLQCDAGRSTSYELTKAFWWFDLRSTGGDTIESSYQHTGTITTDDSSRKVRGHSDFGHSDVFWTRLSAGTYVIRVRIYANSVLWGRLMHLRYIVTPVVLHGIDV